MTTTTAGTAREGMTMDTEHGEHREIARLIGDLRRAERERDDLAATLETRTAEHALAMERVRELLAACEAFSGPDCGTVFDGRDSLCGGCGVYRDDDVPAAHDDGCPRLAARQIAARIRAEVSRG